MPSNSAGRIEELKDINNDSLYEGMNSSKNLNKLAGSHEVGRIKRVNSRKSKYAKQSENLNKYQSELQQAIRNNDNFNRMVYQKLLDSEDKQNLEKIHEMISQFEGFVSEEIPVIQVDNQIESLFDEFLREFEFKNRDIQQSLDDFQEIIDLNEVEDNGNNDEEDVGEEVIIQQPRTFAENESNMLSD